MGGAASKNVKTEHFSLEELLTQDDSVDMRKATIIIWRNRHRPEVISELADLLSEYSDQKTVFEGIEFYLPQLAHMIIHLEVDWPTAALEQFVLIVCQHSLHFALQLHFILVGAMEDYQLEGSDGRRTAYGNPRYYRRCAKLLQNVHRCVVYGAPRVRHLEDLYRSGKLSKTELEEMGIAERKFQAAQILDPSDVTVGGKELSVMEGTLFYKRHVRRSCCHSKGWKVRWFKIQDRVLYCYNNAEGRLRRAIPLEAAEVTAVENPRHEYYFEVTPGSAGAGATYMLKAETEEDMQRWIKQIKLQALAPTFHQRGEEHVLYPAEFGRYQFFKSQRDFINRLTDISEEMRFLERPTRTKALKERLPSVKVPPAAYLPLCKSTDPWCRIMGLIPEEARAFSTKARCPCLVLVEVERDTSLDVANYLHQRYGALDEQQPGNRPALTDGSSTGPAVAASPAAGGSGVSGNGSGNGEKAGTGTDPKDLPMLSPNQPVSVISASTMEPASQQHGQEAPLCLGPLVDSGSRDELVDSPETIAAMQRRISLPAGMRSSIVGTRRMNPTLWRVSRPNIAEELRKIPAEFRAALRKRSRAPTTAREGSVSGPTQLQAKFEQALGISRSSLGPEGAATTRDSAESIRRESDLEDPNKIVPCYGEVWVQKRNRLREKTSFAEAVAKSTWDLQAVIVKSNDDVRQEVFIMQLIAFYEEVFKQNGVGIWLRPYKIMSTGNSTGLIAFLTDAISFDALKKSSDYPGTLRGHFEKIYGGAGSAEFRAAQRNFAQSLAGYSLLSYLLAFKDRHNGNIMIDKKGHVIHIDFGFVLGIRPGGKFSFERPPFKLTREMVDILDGPSSELFQHYKELIVQGFKAARAHAETVLTLMEIMSFQSKFPCFVQYGPQKAIAGFKARLLYGQTLTDQQVTRLVDGLVNRSFDACGTKLYDRFQLLQNGIVP